MMIEAIPTFLYIDSDIQNTNLSEYLNFALELKSEASIGKALKGEVVIYYFEPLITQHMKTSGWPCG
jgi:hypothetical protein